MPSFSFASLVALTFLATLDVGSAASIPKTRDLAPAISGPGLRMTSKSVGTSDSPTSVEEFQDVLVCPFFCVFAEK